MSDDSDIVTELKQWLNYLDASGEQGGIIPVYPVQRACDEIMRLRRMLNENIDLINFNAEQIEKFRDAAQKGAMPALAALVKRLASDITKYDAEIRAEALEEAAQVVWSFKPTLDDGLMPFDRVAEAIRALKKS